MHQGEVLGTAGRRVGWLVPLLGWMKPFGGNWKLPVLNIRNLFFSQLYMWSLKGGEKNISIQIHWCLIHENHVQWACSLHADPQGTPKAHLFTAVLTHHFRSQFRPCLASRLSKAARYKTSASSCLGWMAFVNFPGAERHSHLRSIYVLRGVPSPKLTVCTCQVAPFQKETSLPTIHFQVLC